MKIVKKEYEEQVVRKAIKSEPFGEALLKALDSHSVTVNDIWTVIQQAKLSAEKEGYQKGLFDAVEELQQ